MNADVIDKLMMRLPDTIDHLNMYTYTSLLYKKRVLKENGVSPVILRSGKSNFQSNQSYCWKLVDAAARAVSKLWLISKRLFLNIV